MAVDWVEGDLVVNDARMHYYRLGKIGSTPLVLQHGFSDNGLCWLTLADDLQDKYDIVLPDARGHGRSARFVQGESVDQTADLAGLIRGLELKHPVVAGHSMGARIAAQLGAQYPDLPRALILEDPPWRLPQAGGPPARGGGPANPLAQWIKSLEGLPLEELVDRHRIEHPTWPDLVLRHWSEAKLQLDHGYFSAGDLGRKDWREMVPAIACPTLVITAMPEKGGIVTSEVADMAREMNPLITVAHVPDTGHHVRFENYDVYLATVKTFLAQVQEEA